MRELIALVALIAFGTAPLAAAQPHPATITVSANATVRHAPDIAYVAVALIATNARAADATASVNNVYNALLAKLHALGIKTADVQTQYLNLNYYPRPTPQATPSPYGPPFGYTVHRSVRIGVRNLANVGKVVDAAIAGGVKQIESVSFALSNDANAHNAALAKAVTVAHSSALAMAMAAHARLGRVMHIASGYEQRPLPMYATRMMAVAAPQAITPTEIPSGSLTISATVTIVYQLLP